MAKINQSQIDGSSNWEITFTTVSSNSANWDSSYTTVNVNSAAWAVDNDTIYDDSLLATNSASWNITYTIVQTNSAAWIQDNDTLPDYAVRSLSSNWQNTYTTYSVNSAIYASIDSVVQTNSAQWAVDNDTIFDSTLLEEASGGWNNTELIVQTNSSVWGTSSGDGSDLEVRELTSNWEDTFNNYYINSSRYVLNDDAEIFGDLIVNGTVFSETTALAIAYFEENIGNDILTAFDISHGLSTNKIFPTVIDNFTFQFVFPTIVVDSINNISIYFSDPPTSNQYKISIYGMVPSSSIAAYGGGGEGGAAETYRSDSVGLVHYTGKAPLGSLESASVWDITRTTFNVVGPPYVTEYVYTVSWDDRYTASYE